MSAFDMGTSITRREALAFLGGVGLTAAIGLPSLKNPDWLELTPNVEQFTIRDSARGFVFQNKLWLSGGYMVGNVPRRDLLVSKNGFEWELVSEKTPFAPYSPVTAHDGKMVATFPTFMVSEDGKNWREEDVDGDSPPLSAEKPILSFRGQLVLFTDNGLFIKANNIWRTASTPFAGNLAFSAVVHNDRIVVAGGAKRAENGELGYSEFTALSDVWSTDNPENPSAWVRLTDNAGWRARMWPGMVSHRGWLYIIGGYVNKTGTNTGSGWYSRDGAKWERLLTKTKPDARHAPTVYSYAGRIILLAGNTNQGDAVQNDIWALDI